MGFFEHQYYNTYYYSNIISNILSEDIELIGFISNFFSNPESVTGLVQPFQKFTAFHHFIKYMVHEFFEHDMNEYDEKRFDAGEFNRIPRPLLYAEAALNEFGLNDYSLEDHIGHRTNFSYSDIEAYLEELVLTGTLEELYDKIANEIFYLMFNNRRQLLRFNKIVSDHMDIDLDEIEDAETRKLFNNHGYLKRKAIPEWCKKAVFFRDRGRCCLCTKDLTQLTNINSGRQYDHIVPLARYGLNDVSNIQLICSDCNKKKNKHFIDTSDLYESWF